MSNNQNFLQFNNKFAILIETDLPPSLPHTGPHSDKLFWLSSSKRLCCMTAAEHLLHSGPSSAGSQRPLEGAVLSFER